MNSWEISVAVPNNNNGDGRNSGLSFDINWELKLRLLLLLRHAETINSDKLEEEYEEMWGSPMFKKEPPSHVSVLKVLEEHLSTPTKVRLHYVEQGRASANVSSVAFSRKDFLEFAQLFKRGESGRDSLSNNEQLSELSGLEFEEVFRMFGQNSTTDHQSRSIEAGRSIEAPNNPVPAVKPVCSYEPDGALQGAFTGHEEIISALGQVHAEQTTSADILTAPNNMLMPFVDDEEVNQLCKNAPNRPACNSPMVRACESCENIMGCIADLSSRVTSAEETSDISADDEPTRIENSESIRVPCESQVTSVEVPRSSNSNAVLTEVPKGNNLNLKRPCEGSQSSTKRKAVSLPQLTSPWTSPANSDAGYSSSLLPGSSSERSVISTEHQDNCRDPDLPILENMSIQEIPDDDCQTTQRSKTASTVTEEPSPYLEQHSRKEAGRAEKRKRRNVSTSPVVDRGQICVPFNAPELIFSCFGDLDKNQVLGERKLKVGRTTRTSITNLEDWCYFVTSGEHERGLFIAATDGFVYGWDKHWNKVRNLVLPEGSVIYGDFNRDLNSFRIFDALRLGDINLDDLDYDERRQACSSFVEAGSNTKTTLNLANAESLEFVDDSFRKTLKRLGKKNGRQDVLFVRCHHSNSTFWSVMKNRLTWRCPSKSKLQDIVRKLPECDGGLEFTEILLGS